MKTLDSKVIVYDSNCRVCSSLKELLLKVSSVPPEIVVPFKDLPVELVDRIDAAKFKNAMALIDTRGGSTVYGYDGVAYIFSAQSRLIARLLRSKILVTLFAFLYKTIAYNRYIIATPARAVQCDCFPDRIVRYRLAYFAVAVSLSLALTALFGASLKHFFPGMTTSEAAVQMLLIAGSGWVLQILLAVMFAREQALDYIGHLGSLMVAGLLVLVPWILVQSVAGITNPYVPAISVILSSALMLHLHLGRIRYLGMSQRWTLSWFLLLQGTACIWIWFFHLR